MLSVTIKRLFGAALMILLASTVARAAERLKVVTSFSILADIVRNVGGERVEVSSFVGPDTDMHVFQPSPSAARELLGADLVVVNGLGLDGWVERLAKASGHKGPLVVASRGVRARAGEGGHDRHGHGAGGKKHAQESSDPHAWQDPANVRIYVANIRDALIAADAAGRATFERSAEAYLAELEKLDADIRAAFAPIPEDQRRVITSHDAFGYYGAAYGVRFFAPQGVGGDSEPTAQGVAALIRQIKRNNVKAVFVENISNPRMIEQIARETGAVIGGALYSDALSGPDGPASSYIAMMRHNTGLLIRGIQGKGD